MDFKYLFVDRDYKPSGNFRYKKEWRFEPVSEEIFIDALNQITNFNFDNKDFINNFYKRYYNKIFIDIVSKRIDEYSKYFFRTSCLDLENNSTREKYWLDRGWSKEEIKTKRSEKYGTCSVEFQSKKHNISLEEAKNRLKKTTDKIQNKGLKTKKETGNTGGYSKEKLINEGLSLEEAENKVSEIGSKISKGIKEWNKENPDYYKNGKRPSQIEYWVNKGYTKDEAKEKVSDTQRRDINHFIKVYGKKEGPIKWKERQELWKSKVFNNKQWIGGGLSKVSNELFEQLVNKTNYKILYKNNEKYIRVKGKSTKNFKYDFTVVDKKKIIEFNGDYWHCNPNSKYGKKDYYHSIIKKTAEEIWSYDKEKIELAESYGYNVKVVWEKDYMEDPDKVVKECLEFIEND